MKKLIIPVIVGAGLVLLNLCPIQNLDYKWGEFLRHTVQAWDSKKDPEELAELNEKLLTAVRNGDLVAVQKSVTNGADLNFTGAESNGESPLIIASRLGHSKIVEYLLSQGADFNLRYKGYTALWYAAENGDFETVDLLIEYGADVNETFGGATVLSWSVYEGRLDDVKALVDRGACVNLYTNTGGSALFDAMFKRSEGNFTEKSEIIKLLLENGALVNERWLRNGEEEVCTESIEYIRTFLEKERLAAEQKPLTDGRTYYGRILDYPDPDWVPMPIELKLIIDQKGRVKGSYTIYHFTDLEEVKFSGGSIESEMRLFVVNKDRKEKEEIYITWESQDSPENPLYPARLFGSIQKGGKEYVFEVKREERIIGEAINPLADNYLSRKEMEVFTDLIFGGDLYIDLGAGTYSPHSFEGYNDLPVQDLIRMGEVIRNQSRDILISGSIVHVQQRGYDFFFCEATTAPQYLSGYSRVWSARTLNYLKRWAVLSIYNFSLYTEFLDELKKGKERIFEYYRDVHDLGIQQAQNATQCVLVKIIARAAGSYTGASTRYFEFDTLSPLLEGVFEYADEKQISRLLSTQDNDYFKAEALRAAILLNRPKSVIKLIAKSIPNPTRIDSDSPYFLFEESPLSCAVQSPDIAQLLIDLGFDVNHENYFGKTPLYYGIQFGDLAIVKLLVKNGADVNHCYKGKDELPWEYQYSLTGKRTPLMHAAQHANVEILQYLLEKGADPQMKDEAGKTAIDYAKRAEREENEEFLKEWVVSE